MPFNSCHECATPISDSAKFCPQCGHPRRAMAAPKKTPPNKLGDPVLFWAISLTVIPLITAAVLYFLNENPQPDKIAGRLKQHIAQIRKLKAIEAARVAALTPAEREAEAKAATKAREAKAIADKKIQQDKNVAAAKLAATKKNEEKRYQGALYFAGAIKSALREPESVKWESILANDDASVICVSYRARNGFGGMGREFAVFANKTASKQPGQWNAHCTGNALHDMNSVRGTLDLL